MKTSVKESVTARAPAEMAIVCGPVMRRCRWHNFLHTGENPEADAPDCPRKKAKKFMTVVKVAEKGKTIKKTVYTSYVRLI